MASAIAISRVRRLMATRGLGVTLIEVLFSDNRTVRFRVLSHDPPSVCAVGGEGLPEHEAAVERWLEAHSSRDAA
jgi:hypothetical protein